MQETGLLILPPLTLQEGEEYLLRPQQRNPGQPPLIPVLFVSYCSSPAFVIVRAPDGQTMRCPRRDLYIRVPVYSSRRTRP